MARSGWLPTWLLVLAALAVLNTVGNYAGQPWSATMSMYSRAHVVTALQGRTFGTWTAITAMVRIYAAWEPSNRGLMTAALWTLIIAEAHWLSELLVWGTTTVTSTGLSLLLDGGSLVWVIFALRGRWYN